MEDLIKAIRSTPIIDNHAHPLLIPSARSKYPLLSIATEAQGDAINATQSSLPHIRAVYQLSTVLNCPPTWHDVVTAIEAEGKKPDDAWMKRCLEGIETILIDDGLDRHDEVFDYSWHSRLTREKCKRIVRIEKVAEEIINTCLKQQDVSLNDMFLTVIHQFDKEIEQAILDTEVVGFKSVICYRTGLDIPPTPPSLAEVKPSFLEILSSHRAEGNSQFSRLDGTLLNAFLVHRTALAIQSAAGSHKKPFQFHTGLGDQDITLTRSSPSHMQDFIRNYVRVPIVLLHASYPWTKEAAFLATVYDNVYADIGEIFPFLSRDGQETALREILEICPSEKILWSTDGHRFPERYLLAVVQIREALEAVLLEYVRKEDLTVPQAIRVVQDLLFNTSNLLYNLNLPLKPLSLTLNPNPSSDLNILLSFLDEQPSTKFLRLSYLDFTATPRVRVVPVKHALTLLRNRGSLKIGITKACLGLLQNDTFIPGVTAAGEYRLHAIFSSIRPGPSKNYASLQCEFLEQDNSEVAICPRSLLRRTVQNAKAQELEFLLGFEIEVVFMSPAHDGQHKFVANSSSAGHAWNSARAFQEKAFLPILDEIYDTLTHSGIHIELFHPESSAGQYEFVLPALPPVEAVDTLLHAREIISTVAASHSLRATLFPKPFPLESGTASHVHISISSPKGDDREVYESFYAGVLRHLRAIIAFTYSNPASYDRMVDGCWAGGRWVTWGTQNREAALRKIAGSHWEVKVLDGLANAYLAMASIIAAGTDGVARSEPLIWRDCTKDPATLSAEERTSLGIGEELPRDLFAAIEALAEDEILRDLLGNEVLQRYISVKMAEVKLLDTMADHDRRDWIIDRY